MTVSISSISATLFRYSWMFRNSEAWMLGCQVMNQSVENGSWPLLGDLPETSLYRRSSRSYERSVSDSSTCSRAPRLISVTARSICLASVRMLLLRMEVSPNLCFGRTEVWSGGLLMAAGHQNAGVQPGRRVVGGALAMVRQQAPDEVVVHAKAAQQRVARRDLHHLRGAEQRDQRGVVFADAQAVQRL